MRTFEVDIELKASEATVELTPTIVNDKFAVRYYVRLVAIDTSNQAYWNTHEVMLYRATLGVESV